MRSPHVLATIDLDHVRASAEEILARTGVQLIAVIKADAYGLGASRVADVLAAVADEFAYFSIEEARVVHRPGIVLGPPLGDPAEYREIHVRPSVRTMDEARRFTDLRPMLNVDTGMQRFGCELDAVDDLLTRGKFEEAFTHADGPRAAERLVVACGGRVAVLHAASSKLLDYPDTWLNAVRPGLALYEGAVHVTSKLAVVRQTSGHVGYGGFEAERVGVILVGYSHGLRPAPVLINGRRQRILETGMNTSFVSVDPADREGDEVVLLGDELDEATLATALNVRPHHVLCLYTALGQRHYIP
ncbi:MAG: alanine racemase [Phycisphaerae bacterium]|nr:alanine racemase [Phycisphaerae bacterium]